MFKIIVATARAIAFASLLFVAFAPTEARAENEIALVSTIQATGTGSERAQYIEYISTTFDALARRHGARLEIWVADVAGAESGTIYVMLHYPNVQTWARQYEALRADPEFLAMIAHIETSFHRDVTSDALLRRVH
jgi:hypothetical protein